MMKCDKCNTSMEENEAREHFGRNLCDDCYMDVLSPAKACDPWAVYSAKTFEAHAGSQDNAAAVTEMQSRILQLLEETGGEVPAKVAENLGISIGELEREIATLRHMEKVRAEMRGDKKIIRLW